MASELLEQATAVVVEAVMAANKARSSMAAVLAKPASAKMATAR